MKIFLTVGSMLPFDRLVKAMDRWAGTTPYAEVFGQIGETHYQPINFEFSKMISPSEYRSRLSSCDLVVSHAGMGTVITASEIGRPLIVLPRHPEWAEVTSNHQLATAKWLAKTPGVRVVDTEDDLASAIAEAQGSASIESQDKSARLQLITELKNFINS
ncbi:glycosyltransferase [Denitromonas sp.]|uniref:glycosyltransferase n=1 Tax=Denitromonas sp. TaxID=2734609 RepID=UPI002B0021A0|nr:glycosyltransferase [Denitromonas sp.]